VLCRLGAAGSPAALAGLTEDARRERLSSERAPVAYSARTRHESEFGSMRPALLTLMVAVTLVLLVAAANTTGLLLVKAAGRRREIAVMAAIGASPGRIARGLLVEGLLLAGLAGALGLGAAPLLVRGLLAVAPAYYGQIAAFTLDATVTGAAIALCTLVGVAVSLSPFFDVLRFAADPLEHRRARAGARGPRDNHRIDRRCGDVARPDSRALQRPADGSADLRRRRDAALDDGAGGDAHPGAGAASIDPLTAIRR
jgi:predicted lysophospholipase L1 biosynthesis ABC-type transport system permease subunit